MDKFFSVFGKIAVVLIVLGGIGFGAYYLGQKKVKSPSFSLPNETPAAETTINQNVPLSPSLKAITKTVEGGVPKSAGLAFDQYTLEIPEDWSSKKEGTDPAYEKLILFKGANEISIMQGATGGALCLYPGDPDFEGPSSRFTKFVELTTKDGRLLRRSSTDDPPFKGKTGFTICQKNQDGAFGQPSQYGHTSYSLPAGFDNSTLSEMDAIISSFKTK